MTWPLARQGISDNHSYSSLDKEVRGCYKYYHIYLYRKQKRVYTFFPVLIKLCCRCRTVHGKYKIWVIITQEKHHQFIFILTRQTWVVRRDESKAEKMARKGGEGGLEIQLLIGKRRRQDEPGMGLLHSSLSLVCLLLTLLHRHTHT